MLELKQNSSVQLISELFFNSADIKRDNMFAIHSLLRLTQSEFDEHLEAMEKFMELLKKYKEDNVQVIQKKIDLFAKIKGLCSKVKERNWLRH